MLAKTISPLKAQEVIALLKARYPQPAFAFLEQVADGTGANQKRWADAVGMSVWPSRGYEVYGFEVKVSRSDWLAELRNPVKADAVMKYCDRWWLVAGDASIVQAGELPATWGLMVIKGGKLCVEVLAPQLEPVAYDPPFVASLLRNHAAADAVTLEKRYRAGVEEGRSHAGRYEREQLARLTTAVDEFERQSGLKITDYTGREMGAAVKALRELDWSIQQLTRAQDQALRIGESLQALSDIPEIQALARSFRQAEKDAVLA